jgi:hypothetical protein
LPHSETIFAVLGEVKFRARMNGRAMAEPTAKQANNSVSNAILSDGSVRRPNLIPVADRQFFDPYFIEFASNVT